MLTETHVICLAMRICGQLLVRRSRLLCVLSTKVDHCNCKTTLDATLYRLRWRKCEESKAVICHTYQIFLQQIIIFIKILIVY